MRSLPALFLAVGAALLPEMVGAQDSTRARPDSTRPAPAPAPPAATRQAAPAPTYDFSGVLYTNFQYGGLKGHRTQNRFELDRAYLTFRGTAGERMSWRVTLDVFQQRDTVTSAFYRGWTTRFKYAYGQYDFLRGARADQWKGSARLGMLHTVVIDHEEQFWQRGLAQTAVELSGFFSSADLGAATVLTLPYRFGEVYATVVNGTGYASREVDRFKDFQARLTLTPLANTSGILQTLTISPWISKGASASTFAARRFGTVGPVDAGLQKDRYGVLVGIRDPRLIAGAHWARRVDETDRADTTRDVVPTVTRRTGQVVSLYTIARPLAFVHGTSSWPIAVVLRADDFKPDVDHPQHQRFYIAGLQYALSSRASLTFDYQNQMPKDGGTTPDQKTYFAHLIVNY